MTLTQGSGCAPYSLAGRSVADSTAMASLTVLLSGMMLARREKVKAGGDIFSGLCRSANSGLDETVFRDLEKYHISVCK